MNYLPISVKITQQACLVVGGGNIALRKAKQLMSAGGKLTIVSPQFHNEFLLLAEQNKLALITSKYQSKFLNNNRLVIAATDEQSINQQVFEDCESSNILVNVVDQPDLCRFIVPSIIDRTPLTIAISTGGSGPVFARMLREKLEWLVPKNIGPFLDRVNSQRTQVKQKFPGLNERRSFWEGFFEKHLGWSAEKSLQQATAQQLSLDYELFNDEYVESKGCFNFIDLGKAEHQQLTLQTIKILQKADHVYLTEKLNALLVDLIRRDADVSFLNERNFNFEFIKANCLTEHSDNKDQVVFLSEGHLFEECQEALGLFFSEKEDKGEFVRVGAAR